MFAIGSLSDCLFNSEQNVSLLTGYRHHLGYRANDKQIDGQIEPLRQVRFLIHTRCCILNFFSMLQRLYRAETYKNESL